MERFITSVCPDYETIAWWKFGARFCDGTDISFRVLRPTNDLTTDLTYKLANQMAYIVPVWL